MSSIAKDVGSLVGGVYSVGKQIDEAVNNAVNKAIKEAIDEAFKEIARQIDIVLTVSILVLVIGVLTFFVIWRLGASNKRLIRVHGSVRPARRIVLGMARLLYALTVNVGLGMIAGAILAVEGWLSGAIAGVKCGCFAGTLVGILTVVRAWPMRSVWVACGMQLMGAFAVGFGMTLVDPNSVPPDHAVKGLMAGGIVGIILAEIVKKRISRPQDDEPRCVQCDYCLIGNVSGICPECGTPIISSDGGQTQDCPISANVKQ